MKYLCMFILSVGAVGALLLVPALARAVDPARPRHSRFT